MLTLSMSLSYIEGKLEDAIEGHPPQVMGCPVIARADGEDVCIHINVDNSALLDCLLEMADKGDLTKDWHLNVLEQNGEGEAIAWFTHDKNFPDPGPVHFLAFTYFAELAVIPKNNHGIRHLRFGPGVQLSGMQVASW